MIGRNERESYKTVIFRNIKITTKKGLCFNIVFARRVTQIIEGVDTMENILKIERIEKYYGNKSSLTKAIDNISFEVDKGEFVAIMGASGSGKTTLLNCISTIDKVTAGNIYVGGQNITKLKSKALNKFRREELGFIFQDFNLLDTLTAYENIALALSIQNVNAGEIDSRIRKVAYDLDIESVLRKYPYQMSGGQKQRVASARAIITNPKLVLADEPTGSVILVQHYPKTTPVIFWSLSMRISLMTDRQSVRFSSRVKVS